MAESLKSNCESFLSRYSKQQSYLAYWTQGYDMAALKQLSQELETTVDYMSNSTKILVINKLMDYPILRFLLTYNPVGNKKVGVVLACLLPIGLLGYMIGVVHQKNLKRDIRTIIKVSDELLAMIKEEK